MRIERVWAMPSRWTFSISPIRALLERYVIRAEEWIDPFAGYFSLAGVRNDIDPNTPNQYHLLAVEFARNLPADGWDGVLWDPPYSPRQVSECYKAAGRVASRDDTGAHFYSSVKDTLAPKIDVGGYAISCGWNSNGFGKVRGFEIVEVLLVAHGGQHNDTIVTVERKVL